MRRTTASFTTALILAALCVPLAASAQDKSGGVFDVLKDVLTGGQRVQGYVVLVRGSDVIVRGQDGRTYHVDASGVPAAQLQSLKTGQPVSVEARGASQDGVLAAASIQPRTGQPLTIQSVDGTVQSVQDSRASFKTDGGLVLPLDTSQLVGSKPTVKQGERATLFYEQTSGSLATVWLEPGAAGAAHGAAQSGSAAGTTVTGTPAASPHTTTETGTSTGYQRLHGYVQSVGVSSITLKTDDGRNVTVDMGQVSDEARHAVRPGDLVSVVGKSQADGRFVAEVMQPEG